MEWITLLSGFAEVVIVSAGCALRIREKSFQVVSASPSNAVACRYNGAIVAETMPLIPETKTVYEALGIQNGGYYLIRPDTYIAFSSALLDSSYLATYLDRILIAPKL